MKPTRLHIEPARVEAGDLTLAGRLEHPDGRRCRLWWRLPATWSDAVTTWADPFVVAFVFTMMEWRRDVVVEGRVSPSLLTNLESFMAIWHAWVPDAYQPVHIRAQEELEAPPPAEGGQTIVPFSCGVDSCFTVLRHQRGLIGRASRRLAAGVVMNGFDIQLDQENASGIYSGLLEDARTMLASVGLACIPLTSNFRELPTPWAHSYGAHLVSGLRLLAGRFDAMLIGNDVPLAALSTPWGIHPVSDPYLSSRHFEVADDGHECGRLRKAQVISQWPEAMRHLRVCFTNPRSHANCCRCEKCIRTILAFRLAGCPLPPAFSRDVTNRQICRVRFDRKTHLLSWEGITLEARRRGLGGATWVRAVRAAIRRNHMRWTKKRLARPFLPLRNCIRVIFRGSPLSRRELAERAAADAQRATSRS